MPREIDLTPHLINGEYYYDIQQFAKATNRYPSQISKLFIKGNKIRTLKGIRVANKPMILVSEVNEFPFDSRKYL